MTADESNLIDNVEDLGSIKDRTHYKVTFPLLLFLVGVGFLMLFTVCLVVGLADSELAKIQTDKQVLVRDDAVCLAIKALFGYGNDYRCRENKNVGHLHTLSMVCFVLGWNGVLCIWFAYDWLRLIDYLRGRETEVDAKNNAVDTLLGTVHDVKLAILRPHEYHMATMIYHDTSEFKWLTRTLGATDLLWMMLLTGVVGQANVYLFVYGALFGFIFSILRYGLERTNRRSETLKVYGEAYEPGMIRTFSQPLAHLLLKVAITAILASMYVDLAHRGHPPAYVLTLVLIYVIYIWAESLLSYFFLWMTRGTGGETYERKALIQGITNRELFNIVQWVAYPCVFGAMSLVLVVLSRHEHLII